MGVHHQRFAALLLLGAFPALSQAADNEEIKKGFFEVLASTTQTIPTVREVINIPVVRAPQSRTEYVGGANGRPAERVTRTSDPTLDFQPKEFFFESNRGKAANKLGDAVASALAVPAPIDEDTKAPNYDNRIKTFVRSVDALASQDFKFETEDSKNKFKEFAINPEIQGLLTGKAVTGESGAAHTPSTTSNQTVTPPIELFNTARTELLDQYGEKDKQQRALIQQATMQALSDFQKQQSQADNQQAREDAARRQAEERERQRQAEEAAAAAAGGGAGGGGEGGKGGGSKGLQAVKIEGPQGNPPQLQIPTVPQGEFNPNLLSRPASRGIASVDSNAINPVSLSNQPVIPKMPGKSFADNNGESLKFNSGLPPVKGGNAGPAIQNAGSMPPSNASQSDNAAPAGLMGASNTAGGSVTSGDPYASNGINKPVKPPSYSLVKDGKYGEANSSGSDGDGDGDGDESVDGGGDNASTISTKNLFKEVLVPVAVAKNGPRGVFGYMGLIRTICASPKGKQVGVCSSSRTASLPGSGDANVTVALALTGK